MSKGWQELRLGQDGRWDPTGQLRDAFPFAAPNGEPNAPGSAKFYSVESIDTNNRPRVVCVAGIAPEHDEPQGTLGWAAFTRP